MSKQMRRRPHQGFTLLEVLVALGIVAIIAVLSWRGLEEVLRASDRVVDVDQQLQTLAAVFGQFEKDFVALEFTGNNLDPRRDVLEINTSGLLLRVNRRDTSEPAFREQISWVLTNNGLQRVVRRDDNPDLVSSTPPIPVQGMEVRLLVEPGGWTPVNVIGQATPLQRNDLALQGTPIQLALNQPAPGQGTPNNPPGEPSAPVVADPATGLIRAVELTLTQPNGQAVRRVLLTGGVY